MKRESTYYTLEKPSKLELLYNYADNYNYSIESSDYLMKSAKHLFIKENNDAFIKSLLNIENLEELSSILRKNLMSYALHKTDTNQFTKREKWLDHTIFLCQKNDPTNSILVLQKAQNWCTKYKESELEQFRNASSNGFKERIIIDTPKNNNLVFLENDLNPNTIKIIDRLSEYGFEKYIDNSVFNRLSIYKIIDSTPQRGQIPQLICLFHVIGYLEYFITLHDSNNSAFKNLGKILNTDLRTISGNVNVLNENSNESFTKYTSYKHKEKIKKQLLGE